MVRNPQKHTELEVWRRTLRKLPENREEERQVKGQLQNYIFSIENSNFKLKDIAELEEKYRIRDFSLLVNSCLILSTVTLLFFLHSAINLNLSLAWIAIIGAMAQFFLANFSDMEEILEKVEFGTLMFFASLFVLMRSLQDLQLFDWIGETTASAISGVPAGNENSISFQ
jgi:Na+/H+ antiporter NhaD/arsenite permease-like protein